MRNCARRRASFVRRDRYASRAMPARTRPATNRPTTTKNGPYSPTRTPLAVTRRPVINFSENVSALTPSPPASATPVRTRLPPAPAWSAPKYSQKTYVHSAMPITDRPALVPRMSAKNPKRTASTAESVSLVDQPTWPIRIPRKAWCGMRSRMPRSDDKNSPTTTRVARALITIT